MSNAPKLAGEVAELYASFSPVHAVAFGGSQSAGQADQMSDIDLYVYVTHSLTLEQRAQVAAGARRKEIGNYFWEPGDEWIDEPSAISVDAMFRDMHWIEEQVARVMHDYQATVGYSTCFVYNVRNSTILFDRESWFADLQQKASGPYPKALKRAIVAKNHPILRNNVSSYYHQIDKAIQRDDLVSVNHRVTALLASYFDILFAVNEQFHPGEKRLVRMAQQLCKTLPSNFAAEIEHVLGCVEQQRKQLPASINKLLDSLDMLLRREQIIP